MNKITQSVGADYLMVQLASGFGQHQGMRVSSVRSTGAVLEGGNVGQVWATGGYSAATAAVTGIPTGVRVRKPAVANVPGAPPRGAPV